MTKIGLLSDTHSYLDNAVFEYFKDCDEIWHAGDFGSIELIEALKAGNEKKVIRGVYGNIDNQIIRSAFPENLIFECEGVKVMLQHIGGYPGKYPPGIKQSIINNQIKLFITGHSHILKIMYDESLNCLHMNPGAAGKHGWQKVRTLIRFTIDGDDIKNCEVIELT